MKSEQAIADVELRYSERVAKVKVLVDIGADRSVMSTRLADQLKAFTPLKSPTN